MKTIILLLFTIIFSCSNHNIPKNQPKINIFKSKVVIVLGENPIPYGKLFNIHCFTKDGKSYVPVFTSVAKLKESTKNADLGLEIREVDGLIFLSTLNGDETIIINQGLDDEMKYQASVLLNQFKTEIDSTKQIISSKFNNN